MLKYNCTTDPTVFEIAEFYCSLKPFWWNWFFGWRKTRTAFGIDQYYYLIKGKDWIKIEKTAEAIKGK